MNIEKAYMTSVGIFWTEAEAERRGNRKKLYDYHAETSLEPIQEIFVLVDGANVFQLQPVDVY